MLDILRGKNGSLLSAYLEEVALLMSGNMSLGDTVTVLSEERGRNAPERRVSEQILAGVSFSEAVAHAFAPVSTWMVAILSAAERSAEIDRGATLLADYIKRELVWRDELKRAVAYPAVLLIATTLVGMILIGTVVPSLASMMGELGSALPLATRFALIVGAFFRSPGAVILFCVFIGAFFWLYSLRAKAPDIAIHVPVMGSLLGLIEAWKMFSIVEIQLRGHIPLHRAFGCAAEAVRPLVWRRQVMRIMDRLQSGDALEAAVSSAEWLPDRTARVLSISARTGTLADGFHQLAIWVERRRTRIFSIWATWIPLILLSVAAVLIAFLAQAVLLPAFQIDVIPS